MTGRDRGAGDRGFVSVWTVAMLPTFLLVVGLVLDGGRVLRARSDAFGGAAAAARAGVQELDERAAMEGIVRLDPAAAERAAEDRLAAEELDGTVVVDPDEMTVEVEVEGTVDLSIMPGSIGYHVAATAEARRGP